jgi:hypothetical protein
VRDLLVITPSRGRPERLREMLSATLSLSRAETDIAVGIDWDDPERAAYESLGSRLDRSWPYRILWHIAARRHTLTEWTNHIVGQRRPSGEGEPPNSLTYRAFASLGDDHLPRTEGWDALLLAAIDAMGGTGIAYGNDGIFNERLPTAPVISSDIVRALGWMCVPCCRHMAVDLAWKDLGTAADCLVHVPEVTIEHVHWCAGKAAMDETYAVSEAGKDADREAYFGWRDGGGLAEAVDTVRALRKKAALWPSPRCSGQYFAAPCRPGTRSS